MPSGMAAKGSREKIPASIVAMSRWLLTCGPCVFAKGHEDSVPHELWGWGGDD
jgi:hypothetical protein